MNELCSVGQELWENCSGENYDEVRYKKYVGHIKFCYRCKKGLDIDRVIEDKDLIPIDDEVSL